MSQAPPSRSLETTFWSQGLFVIGIALAVLVGLVVCLYGVSDYDEGGYAYGGWLVWAKGWMPYRDFATRIPPLLYYLYGLPQVVLGPSLVVARLTSIAFSFAALWLATSVARRLAGQWAAVLTVWLFVASLVVLSYHFHALAPGITGFWVILALWALTRDRAPVAMGYLAVTSMWLALLCRHDLLPMAVVVAAYVALRHPMPWKHRLGALAVGVGLITAVLGPLYAGNPEGVLYMLTVGRSAPLELRPQAFMIAEQINAEAVLRNLWLWVKYRVWVLGLLGAAMGLAGRQLWPKANKVPCDGTWLALGLGLAHVVTVMIAIVLLRYSPSTLLYPFEFWPLAVGTAALVVQAARLRTSRRLWLVAAVPVLLLVLLTRGGWGPHVWVDFNQPTVIQQVTAGAALVAEHTASDERIFTVDDPHQFLQAQRPILPELFEAFFGFRDSRDTATLLQLRLFNQELVHRWLSGEAEVAVISEHSLNWIRNSGRYAGGEALYQLISRDLKHNYELVVEAEGTYSGPLRIYRRKLRL